MTNPSMEVRPRIQQKSNAEIWKDRIASIGLGVLGGVGLLAGAEFFDLLDSSEKTKEEGIDADSMHFGLWTWDEFFLDPDELSGLVQVPTSLGDKIDLWWNTDKADLIEKVNTIRDPKDVEPSQPEPVAPGAPQKNVPAQPK